MQAANLDSAQFRFGRTPTNDHPYFVRQFARLERAYPIASVHREALHLLGSEVVDARHWDGPGEGGVWTALVRFGQVVERSLDLNREVMVIYSPHEQFQMRDYRRLGHFLENQPRSAHPRVIFVYSSDLLLARKLEDWATLEPFSVAPMPAGAIEPPVAAASILSSLTTRISRQNLYEERLPVTGDDFFGRRALLVDLVDQLRNGRVCGVFGLRKTGKTSLVKELGRRFVGQQSQQRIFVLRDLEDLPGDPEAHARALHMDLTASLLPRLRAMGLRTHELTGLTAQSSLGDFRRAMQALLGHRDSRDVQMVVALDEIESLVGIDVRRSGDRPAVPELLGVLRSLVQENDNFNVLISGLTSTILESSTLYGRENPLFAWARPYYMPPLEHLEANELVETIGHRMALRWRSEALDRVFELSEGHVFLHRTLCARVADSLPPDLTAREVTLERVEELQRPWRRSVAEQVREMLASLNRYYPESSQVLDIIAKAVAETNEVDSAFPVETAQLVRLGLLAERDGELSLTAFARLATSV